MLWGCLMEEHSRQRGPQIQKALRWEHAEHV